MIRRIGLILLLCLISVSVSAERGASITSIRTENLSAEVAITGTVDQITVTNNGGGSFTLSTPQSISTNSSPTFAGLTITGLVGYLKATAGAVSASSTIPNTSISGLGTISTQNSNAVAITGGTITGVTIPNTSVSGLGTLSTQDSDAVNITGGTITGIDVVSDTIDADSVTTDALIFTDGNQGANKYLRSAADGTASWVTPSFSATSTVVNVKDYGAVVDGVTDSTTAIKAAIAACNTDDVLYFPKGKYKVTDTLTITKAINICGDGKGSMIGMFGNKDLFHFDGTGTRFFLFYVRDLYLLSTSTTAMTALMKFDLATDVRLSDIFFSGADINLYLLGVLRSTFINLWSETGNLDGFITQSQARYGVYAAAKSGYSCNANKFYNCSFRQLSIDYGVYYTDDNGQGSFSWYGGTFEGIITQAFYLSGLVQPTLLSGVYTESNGSYVYMTGCRNITVQSCFLLAANVYNSEAISFDNCRIIDLYIDRLSSGQFTACRQGSGTWTNLSPNFYGGSISTWSGQYAMRGGRSSSMKNLCSGNLETWIAGPLPTGFTKRSVPTIVQESSIALLGSNSCKITSSGAATFEGIEFQLPSDVMKSFVAESVTIRNAEYAWTESSVAGEYYVTTAVGGDPGITSAPYTVIINGIARAEGTVGSLSVNQWDYGNNDGLGFNTIYVKITPVSGAGDPDSEVVGFVKSCDYVSYVTISAYFYSPSTNKASAVLWASNYNYGSGALGSYDSGGVSALASDSWRKCIATFKIFPFRTTVKMGFGLYNETVGDIIYVDGIEVMTGMNVSDRYNDNSW